MIKIKLLHLMLEILLYNRKVNLNKNMKLLNLQEKDIMVKFLWQKTN